MSCLDEPYELPTRAVEAFRRDGHVLLREVCPEITTWAPLIEEVTHRLAATRPPRPGQRPGPRPFLQVMNLWEDAEEVRPFVLARRFGAIAAALMGSEGARLYHDQALFKEPGGTITPFHQDQGFWPFDIPLTVTMWMPLSDLTPDMGPVEFLSGSHRGGKLGEVGINEEGERRWQAWVASRDFTLHSYEHMAAGDATFHAGWTLHRAKPNVSPRMRAAMTIIYHPADARVMDPLEHGEADLRRFLPGCGPGDLAASPLNPVVS